jgi:hemolysin D
MSDLTDPPEGEDAFDAPRLPARRQRRDPALPIRRREMKPLPDFTGIKIAPTHTGYRDFLPPAQQIIVTPPSPWRRGLAYTLCAIILGTFIWSIFDIQHLFAIAPGEFLTRGGTQVVQVREEGQVKSIPVQNGVHAQQNDVVLQLDTTSAEAALAIVNAKLIDARAEILRRTTAIKAAGAATIDKDVSVSWPADIPAEVKRREDSVLHGDLARLAATIADLDSRRAVEVSTRDKYVATITAQKSLIDSRTKRAAMHETLFDEGWDSRAMVLQALEPLREDQVHLASTQGSLGEANAAIAVLDQQLKQARSAFIAENTLAQTNAEQQRDNLTQEIKQAQLKLDNMTLRAPVSGTVEALAVTSVGQALKASEQVMQIVPDGVPLEIQAYVLNADIGFVRVGQPVTIKVDTFPFTRYGTISGKVTYIGADAITGAFAAAQQKDDTVTPSKGSLSLTTAAPQLKDLVFPVTIIPDKTTIEVDGKPVQLKPGMSVVAEIETERQRAIGYVLYPLTRIFRRDAPPLGTDRGGT